MKQVAVALACDENYLPHAATCLNSLLSTNRDKVSKVYLLTMGVSESELDKVRDWCMKRFAFDLQTIGVHDPRITTAHVKGYLSEASYIRLCLPDILLDHESVLYLDVDTLVIGDISPLVEIADSINNHPLSMPAIYATHNFWKGSIKRLSSLGYGLKSYFNAGVMVINLALWREERVTAKLFELESLAGGKFRWMDQDLLNIVLSDSWRDFCRDYNEHSRTFFPSTKIIHFVGPKPDRMDSTHPGRRLYRRHRFQTPYPLIVPKGALRYFLRTLPSRTRLRVYDMIRKMLRKEH